MRSSKRKVIFLRSSKPSSSNKSATDGNARSSKLVEIESSASRPPPRNMPPVSPSGSPFKIPAHFTHRPLIRDSLKTETSVAQDEVVTTALQHLKAALDPSRDPFDFSPHGVLSLDRENHKNFLKDGLGEFPEQFVGIDSSRPWMVYWAIMALWVLGEDVSPYEESVYKTISTFAHPKGGFSGGHGQLPHLASTYPSILTLALLASTSPNPKGLYALTNRHLLWHWLCRLKQPSGGFRVADGAEEDVRAAYIVMVCIALLDLPLNLSEECDARKVHGMRYLTEGLAEWVGRCQSKWEGGIAEKPGRESHGAYAFCGLACLCLMGSDPRDMVKKHLDVEGLMRWLAMRQNAPEGGYSGRTGKLVDGCYTHWVGGCWPLLLGVLNGPVHVSGTRVGMATMLQKESWIASREGVARWVLNCCQQLGGGLCDKPGKPGDTYHTLYALSGLACIQHQYFYLTPSNIHDKFTPGFTWRMKHLNPVMAWETEQYDVFGEGDRLRALHPVFMCPEGAAEKLREWSEGQGRSWGVLEGGGIT